MIKNLRCIDLHIPAPGGVAITSFCFERTALAYIAEIGATTYRITCGSNTLRREGTWPR